MSRRIISKPKVATRGLQGTNASVDGYFDRILKYIPADVIAAWTALTGLLAGREDLPKILLWILLAFFIFLTGFWTYKNTAEPGLPAAKTQISIAVLAFIIWTFAIGAPFEGLSWYDGVYGSIMLIMFTVTVPLIVPKE